MAEPEDIPILSVGSATGERHVAEHLVAGRNLKKVVGTGLFCHGFAV
jgi:hypothetical protein